MDPEDGDRRRTMPQFQRLSEQVDQAAPDCHATAGEARVTASCRMKKNESARRS
jgi:hypothetical protein